MTEKEPSFDVAAWVRRHMAAEVGVTLGAAITAATVAYGLHRNKQRKIEAYLARGNIFELSETNPSRMAMMLRSVTATTLISPTGILQPDIQKLVLPDSKGSVGDALVVLTRADIVEYLDEGRKRLLTPHPDFLTAVVEHPEVWQPILNEASRLDEHFSLEQITEIVASHHADPSGSL